VLRPAASPRRLPRGRAWQPVGLYAVTPYTTYDLTSASIYGHYVQIEGGAVLQSNAGTNSWIGLYAGTSGSTLEGAIRFRATISELDVYCYELASPLRLSIDEVDATTVTLANASAYGWTTVATGLDSTKEHEYLLSWGTAAMYVSQIRVIGSLNTANLTGRPACAFYGDSITFGTAGPGEATLNWTHHMGRLANYQVVNRGIGSTGVVYGGGTAGQTRTLDITGISPAPAVVWITYGIVDIINSVSAGTYQTAYTAMLTAIRAGLPNAWIICNAILMDGSNNTTVSTFNTAIQAAVTGMADAKIVYVQGAFLNYGSAGPLHPIATQCGQIAAQSAIDLMNVAGRGLAPQPGPSGHVMRVGGQTMRVY